jgi:tRNA-dihydrouridine synthase B
MPVTIGALRCDPLVMLAPMSGVTDAPFRRLARRFGAPVVASEMFAAGLLDLSGRQRRSVDFAAEGPLLVQIVGGDAATLAKAARIAEAAGAAAIDLNLGCPMKKIAKTGGGAILMRDPDRAARLIEAVASAVSLPVTVKMRLGWDDDSRNAPLLAALAERAGARMIVVHGRTREQMYAGRADWRAIGEVVAAVSVPVVANGDIADLATAQAALTESGAAGVMIGRAARGRPWLPGRIAAGMREGAMPPPPSLAEREEILREHVEALLIEYGAFAGLRTARKHISWAIRGLSGAADCRARVFAAESVGETLASIADLFRANARSSRSLAA